jgi:hypothetical protein
MIWLLQDMADVAVGLFAIAVLGCGLLCIAVFVMNFVGGK